jgi:hypothetical protein
VPAPARVSGREDDVVAGPGREELDTVRCVRQLPQVQAVRAHDVEVVVGRAVVPDEGDLVPVGRESRLHVLTCGRVRELLEPLAVRLHDVDRVDGAGAPRAREGDQGAARRGRRRQCVARPRWQFRRVRPVGVHDPGARVALEEDPAVRHPLWRVVARRVGCDPVLTGPVRADHVEIEVAARVGGRKRDLRAVGRPRRLAFEERVVRQPAKPASVPVDDVQLAVAVVPVRDEHDRRAACGGRHCGGGGGSDDRRDRREDDEELGEHVRLPELDGGREASVARWRRAFSALPTADSRVKRRREGSRARGRLPGAAPR